MHLSHIRIRNFRNLDEVRLSLDRGLNVFWGSNAQGKTNLLEAIYYLATGRSFRTNRDEECLPFEAAADCIALVDGRMVRGGIEHDIQIGLSRKNKSVRVDGKPLPRLTDLWGVLATVLFTPDDLSTVGGGPSGRRQWIDVALSQVDQYYLDALKRFSRALRQRNVLLRTRRPLSHSDRVQVEAYEEPLAEAGGRILIGRRDFLRRIEELVTARHETLSGTTEQLGIRYEHFLQSALSRESRTLQDLTAPEAALYYAQILAARRNDDMERGQTTRGPHRDDIVLLIDGREARAFASQGQTRTIALSLRLAEVDYIRDAVAYYPLLLLDDILSELDPERLSHLLSSLAKAEIQTILTTTDLAPLQEVLGAARCFNVHHGQAIEKNRDASTSP